MDEASPATGQSDWRQLQACLAAARRQLKAGELDGAIESVERALSIDPGYLAARALRDRITSLKERPQVPTIAGEAREAATGGERPLVSAEGLAKFEARARQRRIDRRVQTARTAIAEGQFGAARAALCEVFALDPECAQLAELDAALAFRERSSRVIPSRGPWFAAALTFAVVLLCATWVERDTKAGRPVHQKATAAASAVLPAADVVAGTLTRTALIQPPSPAKLEFAADAVADAPVAHDVPVTAATIPTSRPVDVRPEPPPNVTPAPPVASPIETAPPLPTASSR